MIKKLIKSALLEHDIYEQAYENTKYIEDFISLNTERIKELCIEFYSEGFKDGYKTHRGDKKDEYGCWQDQEI